RGAKQILTQQAPEGRARDGGLRLGEMERDTLIAHGITRFMLDKFMDAADAYITRVCDICGGFAQRKLMENSGRTVGPADKFFCQVCQNYDYITTIRIPYCFKLLCQELLSMNIEPKIKTANSFD